MDCETRWIVDGHELIIPELANRLKGKKDAENELIECMIYHRMWDSEAYWKTVAEVTAGLRGIKTKGRKLRH